jgi:hypothetical protein
LKIKRKEVNKMKMPGFTANASLYKTGESYIMNEMHAALRNGREIIPQGVKYCVDANGRLYICGHDLVTPYPLWKRWSDLQEMLDFPTTVSEELPSTIISMQEMNSI